MSTKSNALRGLRRSNKTAITYKLMSNGDTSRKRLAKELGLTAASVTQLVQELSDEGLISEREIISNNRRGRREIALHFESDLYAAIGVNIESDKTHVSVCTYSKVYFEEIYRTGDMFAGGNVSALCDVLEQIYATWDLKKESLGVCVGIAGKVDEKKGVSVNSFGILPENFPVVEQIKKRICARVELINNVKAQARSLITEKNENFLFVKHSPGIGCAIVANGSVVGGANEAAGELGHTVVVPDGLRCRCGKRGCLEAYASESRICELYERKTGVKLSIEEIYDLQNDEAATEILDGVMEIVAVAVGNAATLINPRKVVFTGGIFMKPELLSLLRLKLRKLGYGGFETEVMGDGKRIKAFAEAKHLIKKIIFEA